ncbi:NACHT, LRR and PYD domains-containing protein 12 [Brachionichthys hirsutus]|uniref:NACHT, LRR and PYD domains-containing protein 12 n=1 Tax=Brachionichthys hirsutus TaxID=412623 RepID=UPI003604A665
MDKDIALMHILKSKGASTLLGGELPVNVISSNKYISPQTDRNVEDKSPSLDHTIHSALCDETRHVILVGPEGSGKTTALEKLVFDWAKGEGLQNFSNILHFPLREANSPNGMLSLETLILRHHDLMTPESLPLVLENPKEVLIVFDDLDQCKPNLDPSAFTPCTRPDQVAPLSCIVASLLHGSLLKGAASVVASRPTECLKRLSGTRVNLLGFLKPQREAYFNGFFIDRTSADKALKHMERTLGFYDISASPRFSWTVCNIYKHLMDTGATFPETLSQLYVCVLVHLIQTLSLSDASKKELALVLGKMAARCSLGQRLGCAKEEVDLFGFARFPTAVDVFLRVNGDRSDGGGAFSFHSKTMQEFLLAVSLFLGKSTSEGVDRVLEKHRGRAKLLDVFLSALSEPAHRRPLESQLGELNSDRIVDFKCWFKRTSDAMLKGCYKEEHHHCFHLLHQAQSESLVKEVVTPSARMGISYGDLSLQDCVALNYVVTCLGEMKTLNLYRTRNFTEELAETLAPTMSLSHEIKLSDSSLSTGSVPHLASALSRGITTVLDLSSTRFGDEKFKLLCPGLRDCKLQTLKLTICRLTEASCEDLASVLTSASSQLCDLDVRCNEIGDRGFIKVCKALRSPRCKLQELLLQGCELTEASVEALSAALLSGQSQLRKVNLRLNKIGLGGAKALAKSLQHPLCRLQQLDLFDCELTGECCPHLKEALMSDHCSLSALDLSVNHLGQEGALLLCQALGRPGCPLEKLGLIRCELTTPVFTELGSVLRSGTSRLKSLLVGMNAVGDQGVKHLWDAVAHPNCLLEELDLEMTGLTDACVEDLCAAIGASETLKTLELRNNSLTIASVPALVRIMQESQNMLEMNLKYNDLCEEAFNLLEECDKIRY